MAMYMGAVVEDPRRARLSWSGRQGVVADLRSPSWPSEASNPQLRTARDVGSGSSSCRRR